ncbi:uncharacterized protein LOC117613549 [Prunus dulcis]|uniref:uncharacterized protein LOC117613549 n=1 Tax=Prunus dulcis TaxID=3755 RepID=UPI001481DD06|nr:uncharacterized protein LOC117613549 [Prunus dulcis]
MGKKPSTNKTTSQKRCKGKGVTMPVARNKAAKGNNNSSAVTSERGSSSTSYHSNPADHPLFGVRRYTHKNHNSSDPVLHVNVTDHLSYKNTLTHIKGCGNNTLCGLWYRHELPPRVKEKVASVGFSDFAILLGTKGRRDKHLLMALAERWWDTTHTFHLDEVGELTMTPKDFSAITGLPVSGKSLQYDMEAHTKTEEVVRLFGDPIRSILNAKMKYRDIVNLYKRWKPQTPEQEDQLTRVFILAVLGSSLCNDKSDSVYLYYMPSLAKIEEIKDYNRGGAGLACLYLSMDALSRGLVASTGGYWRAWEVWACEYLKPLALTRPLNNVDLFPRAFRWLSAPDVRGTSHNLEQFRTTLRYISTDQHSYDQKKDSTTRTSRLCLVFRRKGIYAKLRYSRATSPEKTPTTMIKVMKVLASDQEIKASLKGFNAEDWLAESTNYVLFRNEYVRYKHYPTVINNSAKEGVCSVGPNFQASEIKIPSWSVQVVGWGDANDCEVLDIPRGKSSTCLPLPEDVKYVSASTATELLDMISGLNSLLFSKCMAARTIISELRQGTHTQHNDNPLGRKEIADAEDDEENDNGFQTSSEDGEEDEENVEDEEDEEDEENVEDEEDEEDEEDDEENVEDEEDDENVEDEDVEENGDGDENDQEDEEDEVLVEETTTKPPPPNTKGKGAVAIKGKGKASPQKRKTSLPEPEPEPHPISKRLRLRKKT